MEDKRIIKIIIDKQGNTYRKEEYDIYIDQFMQKDCFTLVDKNHPDNFITIFMDDISRIIGIIKIKGLRKKEND